MCIFQIEQHSRCADKKGFFCVLLKHVDLTKGEYMMCQFVWHMSLKDGGDMMMYSLFRVRCVVFWRRWHDQMEQSLPKMRCPQCERNVCRLPLDPIPVNWRGKCAILPETRGGGQKTDSKMTSVKKPRSDQTTGTHNLQLSHMLHLVYIITTQRAFCRSSGRRGNKKWPGEKANTKTLSPALMVCDNFNVKIIQRRACMPQVAQKGKRRVSFHNECVWVCV